MRNATTPLVEKSVVHSLQRHRGFSLIELLIVVLIIGVIAAFAYPNYRNYVTEARRSEGQRLLLLAAAQQERFYTQCGYYATAFATAANTPNTCNTGAATGVLGMMNNLAEIPFYSLTVGPDPASTNNIATSYLLTATPSGIQLTNDTYCGNLTLSSQGVKGQSGPLGAGCWKR